MKDGKYLMVWMGVISGSLGGRDDGYPEEKSMVIDSFESLVRNYNAEAKYYKLSEVDVSKAVETFKELEAT